MNLDLAIQNQVLNRSPMETAMYGVAYDLGDGHYILLSLFSLAHLLNLKEKQSPHLHLLKKSVQVIQLLMNPQIIHGL